MPAVVVAYRDTGDFDPAILRARSDGCLPARIGHPPMLGEPVWVVGFPWGSHMSLASGVVSQINAVQPANRETASRLMVDASVSYGASGGGVFDARSGGLIGIVTFHGANPAWYIDVPVPGQTFVTLLADIKRFPVEAGRGDLLGFGSDESRRRSRILVGGVSSHPGPEQTIGGRRRCASA